MSAVPSVALSLLFTTGGARSPLTSSSSSVGSLLPRQQHDHDEQQHHHGHIRGSHHYHQLHPQHHHHKTETETFSDVQLQHQNQHHHHGGNGKKYEKKWSYFTLAVQKWCTSEWHLHGLWPEYAKSYANDYPENCEDVEYTAPTGTLLSDMSDVWTGGNCTPGKTNGYLWEHEWKKHGSCVIQQYPNFTEDSYFSLALASFKKVKAAGLLDKHCPHSNRKPTSGDPQGPECEVACIDLQGNIIQC